MYRRECGCPPGHFISSGCLLMTHELHLIEPRGQQPERARSSPASRGVVALAHQEVTGLPRLHGGGEVAAWCRWNLGRYLACRADYDRAVEPGDVALLRSSCSISPLTFHMSLDARREPHRLEVGTWPTRGSASDVIGTKSRCQSWCTQPEDAREDGRTGGRLVSPPSSARSLSTQATACAPAWSMAISRPDVVDVGESTMTLCARHIHNNSARKVKIGRAAGAPAPPWINTLTGAV